MRWELLFDDLEAQLAAEAALELDAEVADRTRRERANLSLVDRLVGARGGGSLQVRVAGVGAFSAAVIDVGADWVLLSHGSGREAIVPMAALRSVTGLRGRAVLPGAVARGFGLGLALRVLSRDRAVVDLVDLDGQRMIGTIDAIGADTLDLAEHAPDLPRRAENVVAVRTVPLFAIALVGRRV
jgi:hypothetical protein